MDSYQLRKTTYYHKQKQYKQCKVDGCSWL